MLRWKNQRDKQCKTIMTKVKLHSAVKHLVTSDVFTTKFQLMQIGKLTHKRKKTNFFLEQVSKYETDCDSNNTCQSIY